jgi:dTDP-4-amino-4,6-dideoxygalactose transaminase
MKNNFKNLALYRGKKVINNQFKKRNSLGKEELTAAIKVIKSGNLSGFLAGKLEGGKNVVKFEKFLSKFYKVKNAITVNSWTSGLIAIIGSLNIKPGDEIITTPWTMCASATAILHWNAIPVFADIDPRTFCINPEDIKKKISKKTAAILAVDIFGQSSDIYNIKKVIRGTRIKLITDSAQSPYSYYHNSISGTISDIGGFSLNYHKHINTGEGGIVITNNSLLAKKIKMIRNHAEAFSSNTTSKDLINMVGYNFRMGEIEAAIGIEQYRKLKNIIKKRKMITNKLDSGLNLLPGLQIPFVNKECTHNYYIYPLVLDLYRIKYSRKFIVKCLAAEGVQGLNEGYANVHLLPIFKKKIAYGPNGFPWSHFNKKIVYKKGQCPIAEELHRNSLISFELCLFDFSEKDIENIIRAFQKVWKILKII